MQAEKQIANEQSVTRQNLQFILGVAIGSGIGASLEQKNKDNIRPLTEQEKRQQKWGVVIGLALVGLLFLVLTIAYFLATR